MMPEGDTIFRTADTLRRVLEGHEVTRFEAPRLARHRPLVGAVVTAVEARGKHLFVRFDNGLSLHTHMRMTGSWHVYRPDERWRKPPWYARVVIGVHDAVAVCFSAPVVELLDARAEAEHAGLASLGPDLCRADVDLDEAAARFGLLDPETEIGVALLDQRVAAGIGNIYKSETLFVCGIDPFTAVRVIDEPTRRRIFAAASRLLRENSVGSPVRTFDGPRAVYGRARRPCRRCGTPVRSRAQGEDNRTTYWCPTCQPARIA